MRPFGQQLRLHVGGVVGHVGVGDVGGVVGRGVDLTNLDLLGQIGAQIVVDDVGIEVVHDVLHGLTVLMAGENGQARGGIGRALGEEENLQGGPVADDIDTVGTILLRNAGSVKKMEAGLYIVTEDEGESVGIREG